MVKASKAVGRSGETLNSLFVKGKILVKRKKKTRPRPVVSCVVEQDEQEEEKGLSDTYTLIFYSRFSLRPVNTQESRDWLVWKRKSFLKNKCSQSVRTVGGSGT